MILPDTELRGILGHITNINGFRLIICYGFFKYNLIVSEKKKVHCHAGAIYLPKTSIS